jgi:hypothetical protein
MPPAEAPAGQRRQGSRRWRLATMRWRTLAALLAVCLVLLAGRAAVAGRLSAATAGTALRLTWATATPLPAADQSVTVELRVVLENAGQKGSESTSILWEPAFAQQFRLVRSEPPAWRVRVDERGWGVLDTAGVLPGRSGTFQLLFAASAPAAGAVPAAIIAPRIVVVANGSVLVADTPADVRLSTATTGGRRPLFEHGILAQVVDRAGFIPADARGAFPLALAAGALLGLALAAGGVAAFKLGRGRPAPPVPGE